MQVLTKVLITLLMITAASVTTGFSKAPKKSSEQKASAPWYGGKPRPPIRIEASSTAPVAPGAETEVTFTVTPEADCEEIKAHVHGTDGVRVLKDTRNQKLDCAQGVPTEIRVLAEVPAGTEGAVVLMVSIKKDGQNASTTHAIPLMAADSAGARKLESKSLRPQSETFALEPAESKKPKR